MPAVEKGAKILVSGANGFIAVWVVKDLLEHGYAVRGTVRAESKAGHLRKLFASYGDKFEVVVVEDITKEGAFDAAVKGVDAIEHTASPFHFKADDPNEVIGPAVKGTVGILESAVKHAGPQLKRIVVLSSCASVLNPSYTGVLDERNWNEEHIAEVNEKGRGASQGAKYCASKSLAEKAAWDFVEKHKSSLTWDLVTLCPPFVYGPILHEVATPAALNTSAKDFFDIVYGGVKTPEQVAAFQDSWVDVRDLARSHVRAIEVGDAGGSRFILTSGNFVWQDWFDTVNELGLSGVKTPTGTPGAGKNVQHRQVFNTARARSVLGIQFSDMATTAKDSIADFKAKGW